MYFFVLVFSVILEPFKYIKNIVIAFYIFFYFLKIMKYKNKSKLIRNLIKPRRLLHFVVLQVIKKPKRLLTDKKVNKNQIKVSYILL